MSRSLIARMKRLRRQRGWTQAALAQRASMTREGIAKIETGTRTPTLETRRKLAKAFKVPITQLLD